jgi:uncharacterized protein YgiM (DUF1202 family)
MKAPKHRLSGYLPFVFLLLLLREPAFAQQTTTYYVIANPELSLRQSAGTRTAVLTRIPYGAKVEILPIDASDTGSYHQVIAGGLPCFWKKVKYQGMTGYVVDAYLSDIVPPRTGIKDLSSFAAKVSQPFGGKLTKGKVPADIAEGEVSVSRQLYKNGMVYTSLTGYEYNAETLQFPAENIAVVYNLLKNIEDLSPILKTNPDLKEGTTKDNKGTVYTWKVVYRKENGMQWLQSVKVSWEEGGFYNLSVEALETDIVVTCSGGV